MTSANGRWVSVPTPVASAAGNKPNAATSAVIMIGRNRRIAPCRIASAREVPLERSSCLLYTSRASIHQALTAAQLAPGDIDYINLHGTATISNDCAEDLAVTSVFGTGTACSSTKGATGHALGAAGALEAVICALAIQHGFMPGGLSTTAVDPKLNLL